MMNWADVNLVIHSIIDNKIHLENINSDDLYDIEKVTDLVFEIVRKEELERWENMRS